VTGPDPRATPGATGPSRSRPRSLESPKSRPGSRPPPGGPVEGPRARTGPSGRAWIIVIHPGRRTGRHGRRLGAEGPDCSGIRPVGRPSDAIAPPGVPASLNSLSRYNVARAASAKVRLQLDVRYMRRMRRNIRELRHPGALHVRVDRSRRG